jgi:hypothetical protein
MFVLAAVVSLLSGLVTWLTAVNDWRPLASNFTLALMIIVWVSAVILLAALVVCRFVRGSHRRTSRRIERALEKHSDEIRDDMIKTLERYGLATFMDVVEPGQKRRWPQAVD